VVWRFLSYFKNLWYLGLCEALGVLMNEPYMTVDEVATLLRKSGKWVYGKKTEIPGYFKLAGSIFFDRQILETSLKTLAAQPTKKARPIISDDRHGLS
jgi:hypothetical protein